MSKDASDAKEDTLQSEGPSSKELHTASKSDESVVLSSKESQLVPNESNDVTPQSVGPMPHDSSQRTDQPSAINSDSVLNIPTSIQPRSEQSIPDATSTAASSNPTALDTEGGLANGSASLSKSETSSDLVDSSKSTDEPKPRERKRKSGWGESSTQGFFA